MLSFSLSYLLILSIIAVVVCSYPYGRCPIAMYEEQPISCVRSRVLLAQQRL